MEKSPRQADEIHSIGSQPVVEIQTEVTCLITAEISSSKLRALNKLGLSQTSSRMPFRLTRL